jgi:ankyrin repeat protein
MTAIEYAARRGCADTCRLLIERKSALNHDDAYWPEPLRVAAANAHAGIVTLLLDSKADLEEELEEGALHAAARTGNEQICLMLLERKAPADGTNPDVRYNATPLLLAAEHNFPEICALLLKHGADINAHLEGNGNTVMHHAAAHGNLAACKLLLSHNATPSSAYRKSSVECDYYTTPLSLTLRNASRRCGLAHRRGKGQSRRNRQYQRYDGA